MIAREAVATYIPPRELSLRTPPNWTAIVFFAILAGLHFLVAFPAFAHARLEGYLSLIFACAFSAAACTLYFARYQITLLPHDRRIRIRTGVGKVHFQRFIAFDDVHAVRLTLGGRGKKIESCIEILCDNEDIECPPTSIPRQEALFLAITLGVELIKVSTDGSSDRTDRCT
jgi:hypothetical protein